MRRIVVIAIVGVVVILFVVAQLVLPSVAEQRLRDRLREHGQVLSVHVSAFPAIKLLWHQADKVVIRMASYRSSSTNLGGQLSQAADVGTLDASTALFTSGLLTVRDALLRKHGDELTGTGSISLRDLRTAVPFLDNLQPVSSGGGELTLRGTATLLGLSATVDATVSAQQGRLVVVPNVPFGGLATLTLFDNPHVAVQGVSATTDPGGFTVTATGRLH
jgi:hypothetical protein